MNIDAYFKASVIFGDDFNGHSDLDSEYGVDLCSGAITLGDEATDIVTISGPIA